MCCISNFDIARAVFLLVSERFNFWNCGCRNFLFTSPQATPSKDFLQGVVLSFQQNVTSWTQPEELNISPPPLPIRDELILLLDCLKSAFLPPFFVFVLLRQKKWGPATKQQNKNSSGNGGYGKARIKGKVINLKKNINRLRQNICCAKHSRCENIELKLLEKTKTLTEKVGAPGVLDSASLHSLTLDSDPLLLREQRCHIVSFVFLNLSMMGNHMVQLKLTCLPKATLLDLSANLNFLPLLP